MAADRTAEAIREGEQVARERHQAEVEMEQGLIAQEAELERGTGVPIVEQADLGDDAHSDGRSVVTAGEGSGSAAGGQGVDGAGTAIASPGAGTDPDETQTSGEFTDGGPERHVELSGDERTFEGEGRHPLREQ